MSLTPITMANAILEHLKNCGYATATQRIIGHLADHHGWNINSGNKVRQVLACLAKDGKIQEYGQGKKRWAILVSEWDAMAPLSDPGIWKAGRSRAPREVVREVREVIRESAPALTEDQLREACGELIKTQMAELVDQAVAEVQATMVKKGLVKTELHVRINDAAARKVEGTTHASFPRCVRLAAARRNILLVGPAGCGKTHLAEQIANALGLDFAHISCSVGMSEGQLTGRQLPSGKSGQFCYARSEFVRMYEEGGLFLFDEIDAADANTLLVVNSALANGKMAVSNRTDSPVAHKHPDFVAVAAANTYGTGADRQYVGRNQLDESTLDRFRIGQIEMDYDANVESALCPNEGLRGMLVAYRMRAREARLRRVVSSRFLRDAFTMMEAGDTMAEIEASLFAGWSEDECRKVGYYQR